MAVPVLPVFANPSRQWLAGIAVAIGTFSLVMVYHDLWRAKPYSLGTANESLALAAYACFGLCLVITPLQRLLGWAEERARVRRAFALCGAACAGLHILVSLIFEPGLGWVVKHPWSTVLAASSTLVFAALTVTSFARQARRIGARWQALQALAVPAFVLVTLHVLVLGKAEKWVSWWAKGDLPLPPGTLPMTIFGLLVLGVRFADALRTRTSRLRRIACDGGGLAVLALALAWTWPAGPPTGAAAPPPPEVVVFCGSSMRVPTETIIAGARGAGVDVRVDFGGSETILPRLLAGERAAIAILHDPFPDKLAAAGLLATRLEVGHLAPVLVTAPGNPLRLSGLRDLARDGLRLGLPDARYSTCGEYLQARLAQEGLTGAVASRVVVEHRQHHELVTAVRLGTIDAAVVWNFVAVPLQPAVQVHPLPGPWPRTAVAVCTLRGGEAAAQRLVAAAGGEARITEVFVQAGFAR